MKILKIFGNPNLKIKEIIIKNYLKTGIYG